jgi:protein-S-isoprenylcysteine O-methyltransferase Ste14
MAGESSSQIGRVRPPSGNETPIGTKDAIYSGKQCGIALLYGVFCHVAFAIGITAMMLGLYTGLEVGRGTMSGAAGGLVDVLLVLQFVVVHSFLLAKRGRALLARFAPFGIGRELSTTSFAAIASLQLLLKAMADAGLALQTGFLGWGAVVRDRAPHYDDFPARGLFGYVRQPIYLAFALTLWTGPVWTPDHLLLAAAWTLYCVAGPALKERRYRAAYGNRFERYRQLVPYWFPALRKLDARLLD